MKSFSIHLLVSFGLFLSAAAALAAAPASPGAVISLAGTWAFQLDPSGKGEAGRWFSSPLSDHIPLPGTTDEARKGFPARKSSDKHFTRVYAYYGPVWYQREVSIPESWRGKHITLLLERTKTTTVWVDDREIATQDSLVASQVYDLTGSLSPGPHRLTLRVDNKKTPPVGDPHQISDQTQTNWNGVIGRIELRATDPVWIDDVQLYPDVAARKVRVRLSFGEIGRLPVHGTLTLSARSWNTGAVRSVGPVRVPVEASPGNPFQTELALGPDALLWDEFSPALYKLGIDFDGEADGRPVHDRREVDFGLRDFTARGTQFAINGKTVFLRGKHDGCVFPLTGHPPMDVAGWVRVFDIAKSYGINHYRFHTWCPPEAAFAAADITGIYLQPELPVWGSIGAPARFDKNDVEQRRASGNLDERTRFLTAEGERLLRQFGNHPSFVMLSLGNEMSGSRKVMAAMVSGFRAYDGGRRLFAQGSNNFLSAPSLAPGDDYWTTMMTGGHYNAGVFQPDAIEKLVRGSTATSTAGHINNLLDGTSFDYRKAIAGVPVPVIGHEVGQFQSYPEFSQLEKYTGVLRADTIAAMRDRLAKAGLSAQADDFARASGALAVICYREEIESALRTPGFGGFQLLDLQDYPGQGTALVGILDAFMDSKGFVTPAEWRRFCGPVVPLVIHHSYTWSTDQTFTAQAELANYGPSPLPGVSPHWLLADASGKTLAQGSLQTTDIPQGTLAPLGGISFPLDKIAAPQQLTLTLSIPGTDFANSYPLWLYPPKNPAPVPPPGVTIARAFDDATRALLAHGGSVVLLPDPARLRSEVPGAFITDFWCYPMFKKYDPPGTLGLLIDARHPALAEFPTSFHSDWQWWRLARHARALKLDALPRDLRPIVQVIDNPARDWKLALLWEAKVGPGKLLVCTSDLLGQQDAPEVVQFTRSLLDYAGSPAFNPRVSVDPQTLAALFAPNP